jgi:hypothetical protein
MGELISLKGVGSSGMPKWSWCIPAGLSPECMPVVVQCMTQDGLRFLPTNIAAPREYRNVRLEYVELLPSEGEISLAESMWAWLTSSWQAKPDAEKIVKAIGVLHDLLATARFVSMSVAPCLPADHDMPESALFFGRSVHVRVRGLARPVTAWITSFEDPVELVSLDCPGGPRRFLADWSCLREDGTLPEGRAP